MLAAVCGTIIFWLLKPYEFIVASQPTTLEDQYFPGGPVNLHYESFCVTDSVDLHVQRIAHNLDTGQALYLLPYAFEKSNVPAKCYDDLVTTIPLPQEMLPGNYKLEVRVSYEPNPVRKIEQGFTTNEFQVIAPAD